MNDLEVYKEACSILRHYSSACINIRLSVIAQGILILSGAGFLYRENLLFFTILASIFGLLFTIFLLALHVNYQSKAVLLVKSIVEIEKNFPDLIVNPVTDIKISHEKFVGTFLGRILVVQGIFHLLNASFTIIIIFSTFRLIKSAI